MFLIHGEPLMPPIKTEILTCCLFSIFLTKQEIWQQNLLTFHRLGSVLDLKYSLCFICATFTDMLRAFSKNKPFQRKIYAWRIIHLANRNATENVLTIQVVIPLLTTFSSTSRELILSSVFSADEVVYPTHQKTQRVQELRQKTCFPHDFGDEWSLVI